MNAFEMLKMAQTMAGTEAGSKIVDPGWKATIAEPQHYGAVTVPGYQQFDHYDSGAGYLNKGAPPSQSVLASQGYRVPDLRNLPEGQYHVGDAANASWRRYMAGRPMPAEFGRPAMEGAMSLVGKPGPRMTGVNTFQMSNFLNSWRRKQMVDPAFSKAFKLYSHPSNAGLVSRVGRPLQTLKSLAKAI